MASRPAWTVRNGKVIVEYFEFAWNGGFAVVQKQKNITALHEQITEKYHEKALEVSSKSTEELGRNIGAFSLKRRNMKTEDLLRTYWRQRPGKRNGMRDILIPEN